MHRWNHITGRIPALVERRRPRLGARGMRGGGNDDMRKIERYPDPDSTLLTVRVDAADGSRLKILLDERTWGFLYILLQLHIQYDQSV
jgi:hypothetical protein